MIELKQNVPELQRFNCTKQFNCLTPTLGVRISTEQFDCKIQMCRVTDAQAQAHLVNKRANTLTLAKSEFWRLEAMSPPNPRISNALMEFRKMKSCYSGVEVNSAIQPTNQPTSLPRIVEASWPLGTSINRSIANIPGNFEPYCWEAITRTQTSDITATTLGT